MNISAVTRRLDHLERKAGFGGELMHTVNISVDAPDKKGAADAVLSAAGVTMGANDHLLILTMFSGPGGEYLNSFSYRPAV